MERKVYPHIYSKQAEYVLKGLLLTPKSHIIAIRYPEVQHVLRNAQVQLKEEGNSL